MKYRYLDLVGIISMAEIRKNSERCSALYGAAGQWRESSESAGYVYIHFLFGHCMGLRGSGCIVFFGLGFFVLL
jgi:hypothetical protein